jgi:hypothetical protein
MIPCAKCHFGKEVSQNVLSCVFQGRELRKFLGTFFEMFVDLLYKEITCKYCYMPSSCLSSKSPALDEFCMQLRATDSKRLHQELRHMERFAMKLTSRFLERTS